MLHRLHFFFSLFNFCFCPWNNWYCLCKKLFSLWGYLCEPDNQIIFMALTSYISVLVAKSFFCRLWLALYLLKLHFFQVIIICMNMLLKNVSVHMIYLMEETDRVGVFSLITSVEQIVIQTKNQQIVIQTKNQTFQPCIELWILNRL